MTFRARGFSIAGAGGLGVLAILLLVACDAPQSEYAAKAPVTAAAASASAQTAGQTTAAGPAALPKDVQAFVVRRDLCDHLRGEDASSGEAVAALERACRGTDAELARLRRQHARNAAVIRALADYDPEVE